MKKLMNNFHFLGMGIFYKLSTPGLYAANYVCALLHYVTFAGIESAKVVRPVTFHGIVGSQNLKIINYVHIGRRLLKE